MSLFRKQTPSSAGIAAEPGPQPAAPLPAPPAPPAPQAPAVIAGSAVDFGAVYDHGQVTLEERDRVRRAEALLQTLPHKAPHKKEIVDATLKAFGVDADKIVDAANKEQRALQAFIASSHEQAQRVLDQVAQRVAELEAEIERCRLLKAQATTEQEDRARQVNAEMLKVQQVLEFFGHEIDGIKIEEAPEPDEPTEVGTSGKRPGIRRAD